MELIDRTFLAIDNGDTPINIFIDLSKAFDTLNHNILLAKLKYYGISNLALSLFENYLQNHKQYVSLNDVNSNMLNITTGVPQGSILGPLLFIIYINDLPKSSTKFHSIMYADDTTLSTTLQSFDNAPNERYDDDVINKELSKIYAWLSLNKLSINVSKSKYIVHSIRKKAIRPLKLNINGIEIEKVNCFNFLGLTLTENLKWKDHIDNISNKCCKTVGIINKLKYFLPTHVKLLLYNTLIVPHICYCILAWGFNYKRILNIQKKAIRLVNLSAYNAHTEPLFRKYRVFKIKDILQLQELKFYYKFTHHQLPSYLQQLPLLPNSSIHKHNTRINENLHISRTIN